jgi:type I restriction enzyme R subunit
MSCKITQLSILLQTNKISRRKSEFDTKQATKKLRAYVDGHEFAIVEKAKIMIDHFHRDVNT